MADEQSEIDQFDQYEDSDNSNRTPMLLIAAALIGGLLLVCLFAYLLFYGDGINNGGGDDGESVDNSAEITPTPFGDTFVLDSEPLISIQVDQDIEVGLAFDNPTFLNIGGNEFSIQTETVNSDGAWLPSVGGEQSAIWLNGTIINYVFGLPDTSGNRELINALQEGDEFVISMKSGVRYRFAFYNRDIINRTSTDIYDQTVPGVTLLLVGTGADRSGSESRLVARGSYLVAEALEDTPTASIANLGEATQLGAANITVTGGVHVYDRPEAPAGFDFYLVEYEIANASPDIISASDLRLTLTDELGTQYAQNPVAAQLGNLPPLGAFVNSGETIRATVGYQIPAELNTSSLLWRLERGTTGEQVQVRIPFAGSAQASSQAVVSLLGAEVTADARLVLQGDITNPGDQQLIVTEEDMNLVNNGTVYLILSTNPGFPWVVSPGQTIPFTVSFQQPLSGDQANFTLLNQSFQLNILR